MFILIKTIKTLSNYFATIWSEVILMFLHLAFSFTHDSSIDSTEYNVL